MDGSAARGPDDTLVSVRRAGGSLSPYCPLRRTTVGGQHPGPGALTDVLADRELDLHAGAVVPHEGNDDSGASGTTLDHAGSETWPQRVCA